MSGRMVRLAEDRYGSDLQYRLSLKDGDSDAPYFKAKNLDDLLRIRESSTPLEYSSKSYPNHDGFSWDHVFPVAINEISHYDNNAVEPYATAVEVRRIVMPRLITPAKIEPSSFEPADFEFPGSDDITAFVVGGVDTGGTDHFPRVKDILRDPRNNLVQIIKVAALSQTSDGKPGYIILTSADKIEPAALLEMHESAPEPVTPFAP